MKKRGPSKLTILFGALGLLSVMGLLLYFLGKFFVEKVDSLLILAGLGLIFFIALLYELKKGFKQKKKSADFLVIANSIRPDFKNEIESFFKSKKGNANPIDLFQTFMFDKGQVTNIDWSGEESEGEIEAFVESITQAKITWTKANELREKQKVKEVSSDKFLIKLFKAIDVDLKTINLRLLFLKTDGDFYSITTVDNETFEKVLTHLKKDFYAADKL
ncbi:MAG: hypothetical protein IM627_18080 [Cytophagales bacterium]|nr:hypothetical protein [Cytophagales bacterium]